MAESHNWNQFHKALLKLGYTQVSNYENKYLYYHNAVGTKVTLMKSNRLDDGYVHKQLALIGIDHKTFISLYSQPDQPDPNNLSGTPSDGTLPK